MPWVDGDVLSPENMNTKGASAPSVDGFSTNTLGAEVGSFISALGNMFSASTLSAPEIVVGAGSAVAPAVRINSEESLGLFRSAASQLELSYGTFRAPLLAGAVSTNTLAAEAGSEISMLGNLLSASSFSAGDAFIAPVGTAIAPAVRFASEQSLGFYRSAASELATSYGTFVPSNLSATGHAAFSTVSVTDKLRAAELWTSGLSALGSVATLSRVSSSGSVVANEVWASGVSVGSIVTASRLSSSGTVIGSDVWASGLSVGSSATLQGVDMKALKTTTIAATGQITMDDGGVVTDVAGVVVSGSAPTTQDYVDGTIWCEV